MAYRQQRLLTAGKGQLVLGIFSVAGEIKPDGGVIEHGHLLGDGGLDRVIGAAAEAVDAQHHLGDRMAIRLAYLAGNVQLTEGDQKCFFHSLLLCARILLFPTVLIVAENFPGCKYAGDFYFTALTQ